MEVVAFTVFVILYIWREADLIMQPHPRVEFNGFSPAITEVMYFEKGAGFLKPAYFVRLAFKNNAKNPSGVESTAQALTASITIFDKSRKTIDAWEGRWANQEHPCDSDGIWLLNRIDLPANNQEAILDIGFRHRGRQEFEGWDNKRLCGLLERKSIKPGFYKLQVTLAASNFKKKDFRFNLTIPEEPQSDSYQVQIEAIN